ncbi:MAG: ribonuclease P protein component [bacterium]
MDERFRPTEHLRKKTEITAVLRQPGRQGTYCVLHVLPCGRPYSRLGLVVSRAAGPAVSRNRAKRRIREIFRRVKGRFTRTADLVIRARRTISEATYGQLAADITGLMIREHLLEKQ